MKAALKHGRIVDEAERDWFLVQKETFGWVKLHFIVWSCNDSVETTQFKHLPFHLVHARTKIKDEVIAKTICDLHTSSKSVSLSWSKDNVHLLVWEMILQKLLVIKAISGAR